MWWLRNYKYKNFVFKLVYDLFQAVNGSSISWYAQMKGKPCFPHGMKGIFISGAAVIGKNSVIFHQVTIGTNTLIDSKSAGAPTIGDNVYIGAGAKIIGDLTIGDNVRIGANAVIYKDVPDNSVVTSSVMQIQSKQNLDNRFYNFPGEWVCFDDGEFTTVTDEKRLNLLRNIKL